MIGGVIGMPALGIAALNNLIQVVTTLKAGCAGTVATAFGTTRIAGALGGLGLFVKQDRSVSQAVYNMKMVP